MTVLDDLEAAQQKFKDMPETEWEIPVTHVMVRPEQLDALLAVCRAAVAYREAVTRPNGGHTLNKIDALLAATEGLT